ncbi:protein kinase [Embleya sp. NPDC056575]|uniref:serine/threonine-protein kinase n=1 Tax=unclassified Embleya TaxID=2699296 RepID=UPI0036A140E6
MERGELVSGRYELVKRLGRGGMGEVWAGRDRMLHRDVAIKMLLLDRAMHADLPRRFEREAVAAAQINHPNVVALYDRGIHEDLWFLVMERVDGADLAEYIRDGQPLEPDHALAVTREICTALAAAHRAGVVHYDIKPHNVMITPDGAVKVVDFGIAGFVQTAFTLAASSQLAPAGTPQYGAPEQFLTERGDERSDLYALGSVLFALLTGHPPFTGHTGFAIMQRKLTEAAPHLDTLRPGLPPALTDLVAELLEREPEHRPQTAEQVLERLDRLGATLAASGLSAATAITATPSRRTFPPPPVAPETVRGDATEIPSSGQEPTTGPERDDVRERLLGPALLLALFAVALFLPAYGGTSVKDALGDGGLPGQGVFAGLATTLLTSVTLTRGDTAWARLVGHAGWALALGCLLWLASSNPPYYDFGGNDRTTLVGMWLFYLTTALTIALYIHRDIRTRARPAQPGERFVLPAGLLVLFAITLFQPAYLDPHKVGTYWTVMKVVGGDGPMSVGVLVGLAATLAATAALAPGSGMPTRLAGYAGAVLAAACLVNLHAAPDADHDAHPTYFALRLFHLTAALTIAAYIHRDTTRKTTAR